MPNKSMNPIRINGYAKSKLVSPRFQKDHFATNEAFKSRGDLFTILGPEIVNELTTPSLVSSIHGQITRIFFTIPYWVFFPEDFPSEAKLINEYSNAFRSIIASLPNNTVRTILTHEIAAQKAQNWIDEFNINDKSEIITVSDEINFTVWAEDAYCICNDLDDGETYFVEPASFNRADDAVIADRTSQITNLETTQVRLYFQGGNVLIGDDFWFIGADYPTNSLNLGFIVPQNGETEKESIKRVYGNYMDKNRNLIVIGSKAPVPSQMTQQTIINDEVWDEILYYGNHNGTVQPLFHIDMFISLAGKNDQGNYRILVADPKMAHDILGEDTPDGSMQSIFNDISNQLTVLGFEVIRNPMPLVYDDDDTTKTRYWYFATSNNVLVQDDQKIVWIPTYGHDEWLKLSITDDANKNIWESLGYEVIQLSNFHPFAANLGAAHCITKYLSRV